MTEKKKPDLKNMDNATITRIVIIRSVFTIIFMLAVLFLSAGTLSWWEGWAHAVLSLAILTISRIAMLKNDPEMIIERITAEQEENVKSWDKVFVPVIALYLPLVAWIVAGLDKRFGWSPDIPDGVQWAALVVNFLGNMFSTWATFTNRFFSSHVRIQTDRGHKVVKDGPYRFVRHPGYAGGIFYWLTTPIFFGSRWLWIPSILTVVLYVVRTALEDRTLQEELPGYRDYTREVRYRLLPGIW